MGCVLISEAVTSVAAFEQRSAVASAPRKGSATPRASRRGSLRVPHKLASLQCLLSPQVRK